ncbi:MAG: Gfo/Idh/MocA family oxidoreductase, partial [Anaerolineae bacterium]|nr:Gfo/Idh/MocA family oxidoreductase [Anaerolineae bacterium]
KLISEACLNAGKHVYSEKPLATTYEDARALVKLAAQKGLRLGCSPFTLMGEGQQTAWKLIRAGRAGKIRVAYAEVNWGRIESWHPAPGPFYEVGALFDVGVYPLTILTALFGPARRVLAYGKVLHPDRVSKEGVPFHINTPDWATTIIELADDTVVRLTTNFYVSNTSSKQHGIEFHGDLGTIYMDSWQNFNAQVEFAEFGEALNPVELVKAPPNGSPWGRGVHEMVLAMQAGKPHRFTGDQAAHVVEILTAAALSMRLGQTVEVESSFTPPTPMEWAE